jgi:hypothetical protein
MEIPANSVCHTVAEFLAVEWQRDTEHAPIHSAPSGFLTELRRYVSVLKAHAAMYYD